MKDIVLLEPLKLDSATDYELRKKLREKKIRVKMVKNTLAKKVFTENGVKVDLGSGPTLLVWGADSIKELGTAVDGILKELKKDPKAPDKFKEKTAVADGATRHARRGQDHADAAGSHRRCPRRAARAGCSDRRLPHRPGQPARRASSRPSRRRARTRRRLRLQMRPRLQGE